MDNCNVGSVLMARRGAEMRSVVACALLGLLFGCASASDGSTITPPSIGAGLPGTQPTPSTRLDSGISPRLLDAAVVSLDSVVAPQDMTLEDALAVERDEGLPSEIDAIVDAGVFDNDAALADVAPSPSNTAPFEDLLTERVGFGAEATGGAGGQLCIVSSTDNDGPGTLRNCIEGAEEPTWVRFAIDGDIRLRTPVALPSDMTIDGREHYIRLFGHGFELHDVSNVIVTNIIFKEGNDGGDNDAIQIKHGAHDIWIHHVSLSNYGDGLIDITRAATDVTISWCKFSNHRKVMLIGSDPDQTDDRNIRVTLHHNWFKRTNSGILGSALGRSTPSTIIMTAGATTASAVRKTANASARQISSEQTMTARRLPGGLAMTAAVGTSEAPMTGVATARRFQKGAMFSRRLTSTLTTWRTPMMHWLIGLRITPVGSDEPERLVHTRRMINDDTALKEHTRNTCSVVSVCAGWDANRFAALRASSMKSTTALRSSVTAGDGW